MPEAKSEPTIDPKADRSFIAEIKTAGIPVTDNEDSIILPLSVCQTLADDPSTGLVDAVGGILYNDSDLTRRQAARFVGAGVQTYCPERAGQLGLAR